MSRRRAWLISVSLLSLLAGGCSKESVRIEETLSLLALAVQLLRASLFKSLHIREC